MILGPKFKKAKRLGAPIFEKCATPQFANSVNRTKNSRQSKRPRALSDFGRQMREKQKMRLVYGLSEKQFSNYVAKAVARKGVSSTDKLFQDVELRLDNVIYRLGLAKTRRLGRQLVSHGHITVNGRKVTVPSYATKEGDVIAIREGSKKSGAFANLKEVLENHTAPAWLKLDAKNGGGAVQGMPVYTPADNLFDIREIIEFYSR